MPNTSKKYSLDWTNTRPLFRFWKTFIYEKCELHQITYSEREIIWRRKRGYVCKCGKEKYKHTQIFISVLGNPVSAKPNDAIYMIKVLKGINYEAVLERAIEEEEVTESAEFTIFDLLDDTEDTHRVLVQRHFRELMEEKNEPGWLYYGSEYYEKHYGCFTFQKFEGFAACTGQDKYIEFFMELILKLMKPATKPEAKECAHISRKQKAKITE